MFDAAVRAMFHVKRARRTASELASRAEFHENTVTVSVAVPHSAQHGSQRGGTAVDGYTVDIGTLNELVSSLEHAADLLTTASDGLRDASANDLGSPELVKAGAAFQQHWEYGIGRIARLSSVMAGGLRDTSTAYQTIEDATARAFSSGAGTLSMSPGAASAAAASAAGAAAAAVTPHPPGSIAAILDGESE
jgi:hypothetical protein